MILPGPASPICVPEITRRHRRVIARADEPVDLRPNRHKQADFSRAVVVDPRDLRIAV